MAHLESRTSLVYGHINGPGAGSSEVLRADALFNRSYKERIPAMDPRLVGRGYLLVPSWPLVKSETF